jgi:hypothetical protein
LIFQTGLNLLNSIQALLRFRPYSIVIVTPDLSQQVFSRAARLSSAVPAFAGESPDSPLMAVAA